MSAAFDADRRRLLVGGAALSAAGVLASSGCANLPRRSAVSSAQGLRPSPLPAQAPAKQGMAKLADVSLWYWDTGGSGQPIVLLHPFTGSGLVWSYQQPVFAHAGFRVIGYSRRAFHNSEVGPKDRVGTGSEDLHALLHFLGIDRFHAVSSAGGAFVAADYALSHPERLHSLVLACSILGVRDDEITKMLDALLVPGYENLPAYFRELSPSYRAADPQGTARWQELERNSMPGERIQQAYANRISLQTLERLQTPTLLIAGDADLIAPPPLVRAFARHIPNSQLKILPECGHSAYWEQPELFNDAVLNFVRQHRT